MDSETKAALWGAVIGGVLTAISSVVVLILQFKNERKTRDADQRNRVDSVLLSMYHELKIVWNLYQSSAGAEMDKFDGQGAFDWTFPSDQNYYSAYEGNAQFLGSIPDSSLREKIVNAFTMLKSLKDGFILNNRLIAEYEDAREIYKAIQDEKFVGIASPPLGPSSSSTGAASIVSSRKERARQYGPGLKDTHERTKAAVNTLLAALERYFAEEEIRFN